MVQSSLNKFIELRGSLWNQANVGPWRLAEEILHTGDRFRRSESLPDSNGACGHKDR